jgi:ubiquitin conjugation factor E4 B
MQKETKLHSSDEAYQRWLDEPLPADAAPPNFISECFYLTVSFLHIGPQKMYDTYNNLERELGELENAVKNLENTRSTWMSVGVEIYVYVC